MCICYLTGRLFDGHVLDMFEFGVEKFTSMKQFAVCVSSYFFLDTRLVQHFMQIIVSAFTMHCFISSIFFF
jgi:hypothetical protein